jgi:branched-chain amino acid transport system substrate-binding protein
VVNRLINQDNCNFIHVFMDQVYHACRPMFLESNILTTLQGQSPDSIGSDNPMNFRTLLSNPYVNPQVYTPWIYDELEVRSVACLRQNAEIGELFWNYYEEEFEKLGVEILDAETYDYGTTDYTSILTKIMADNPDMIILPQPPSEAAGLIVKQARELGYEGVLFEGVCPATPTLVDLAGWDNLEGFYSTNAVSQPFPYPQQQWFYDQYTAIHGEDAWSGGLFDRADDPYNLTLAIMKADSLDTADVTKAWEEMTSDELFSFFGPDAYMGGLSVWDNNHCLIPRHWVSMITDGKEINLAEVAPPPGL